MNVRSTVWEHPSLWNHLIHHHNIKMSWLCKVYSVTIANSLTAITDSLSNRRNYFLVNKIKFRKLHWLHFWAFFLFFEFATWSSLALESSTWGFSRVSDPRDYNHHVTWPIQKIQNYCHKILQLMRFPNLILLPRKNV